MPYLNNIQEYSIGLTARIDQYYSLKFGVRILARAGDFSLLQNVKTVSGTHLAFWVPQIFPGVKRPGT